MPSRFNIGICTKISVTKISSFNGIITHIAIHNTHHDSQHTKKIHFFPVNSYSVINPLRSLSFPKYSTILNFGKERSFMKTSYVGIILSFAFLLLIL